MVYEFKFPDVGEGITEGRIVEWKVKVGDIVEEDQILGMIETDKAVVEIPSPKAGKIIKLHTKVGESINVGDPMVSFELEGDDSEAAAPKEEGPRPNEKDSGGVVGKIEVGSGVLAPSSEGQKGAKEKKVESSSKIIAIPRVRRLAKDLGVDLNSVKGSGEGGEITENDVRGAKGGKKKTSAAVSKISFEKYGRIMKIPMTQIRKTIAEKMHHSVSTIPHSLIFLEADVTDLAKVRQKEKKSAESKGIHLTFLPFIVRAVVSALKTNPYLNSSLDDETETIITKQYYNIGIAVDTANGLMVPVVKKADSKSILDIAKEIDELAGKAKSRKISLEDLQGGTFTITNYGSIAGSFAVPIINYPEAAILGFGRITEKPVIIDGEIKHRKMLPLSLAFDHRILDGGKAAMFLKELVKHLEDPQLLLVDID